MELHRELYESFNKFIGDIYWKKEPSTNEIS